MSATAVLGLQRAGFTERQVEALAGYVDTRFDISQLATKADLIGLRSDLAVTKADLELKIAGAKADMVKWVVGVGFAQVATILAVLKLFPGASP